MSREPHFINPLRLANAKERIEGSLKLSLMERLQGLLDYNGQLHYCLSFDIDGSGFCYIESEISVAVMLQCQRCLKPFTLDIHKRNLLGVVNNKKELDQLASSYEPLLLLEDGYLLLNELLEDELLLALPVYPLHKLQECTGQAVLERINAESKPTPFSILESLKKDKN